MNVGQRIRELRKAKKMTINQLASLTEWDVGNISRLERGMQGYSEASLKKIAEALEVPLAELFSFQDKKDTVDTYSINSLSSERRRDVYRVDVMDVSASAGNGNSTRDFIEVISSI
ncbi:helix-turn-helix transcriptional regulator, partial [Leclercia adecarboxylata]